MVPYRIMAPTLLPFFIMLRKLRILPCEPVLPKSHCSVDDFLYCNLLVGCC